jgi:hypothetical protein
MGVAAACGDLLAEVAAVVRFAPPIPSPSLKVREGSRLARNPGTTWAREAVNRAAAK